MAKVKVYELAKEFKVSSEALVQLLRTMNIAVKSHMSTVDENLRDDIKKKFESERAAIKQEYDRKRQVIAKKQEDMLTAIEKKDTKAKEAAIAAAAPPPQPVAAPKIEPSAGSPPSATTAGTPASSRPGDGQQPRPPKRHHFTPRDGNDLRVGFINGPVAPVENRVGKQETLPPAKTNTQNDRGKSKKKKGGRFQRKEIAETELKSTIKKTLAKIGAGTARKKYKKDSTEKDDGTTEEKKTLNVSEFITPGELSNMIGAAPSEVIAKCLELGLFVTVNKRLDFETIELLADEFGYSAKLMDEYAAEEPEEATIETEGELIARAPVVTIMGHVDHGKTSLLDYIRKTNVIAGEAGGITQHIAAYEVHTKHGPVTFLDTPGHEAFSAMRARGSQVTDVVVLVVAADSGVMPQTKEAIDHARAAKVPIVVAINKTDLPHANIDKVKSELAQYNVIVEDFGGEVASVEISAKTGKNIDKLLERLALETEMLVLRACPTGRASGVVIESELDKGRGPIATILVQRGVLRKGDPFVTGIHSGRVRELYNERGVAVESALPSQPVVVLGLSGTPQAGDSFKVVEDEKDAREISARRRLASKERELRKIGAVSLDHLYEQIKAGAIQSFNIIIKGDVDGSVEALAESCTKFSNDEIKVNVIHKSVGAIKEADINLAAASKAIIIGFHLSPNTKIRELAKRDGVDIRTYRIIYEVLDDIKAALEGMLAPEIKETVVGQVEVRQVFKISKVGLVAGCMVLSGTVTRGAKARVIRDDVEVIETTIGTLRRHKDEAREVTTGHECGVTLDNFTDYKEGDRIEVIEETKIARKL